MTQETTGAATFFAGDGEAKAYAMAAAFAGEGGRVATLPDLIDARIAAGLPTDGKSPVDPIWTSYYTTSSAEFVGTSRGGVPVIAVLHGHGPLADVDGFVEAYSHALKNPGGLPGIERGGGWLAEAPFRDILDREDVHVVTVAEAMAGREYPFISTHDYEAALADPLLRARFGGWSRLETYLDVQAKAVRAFMERQRQGIRIPDDAKPRLVANEGSREFSYVRYGRKDERPLPNAPHVGAYAALLSIGGLSRTGVAGGYDTMQFDVTPHAWRDGTRFVGLKRGASLASIRHDGASLDMDDLADDPRVADHVWTVEGVDPPADLDVLTEVGDGFFVQYPKDGARMDTGEPMHRVVSATPVGGPVTVETDAAAYPNFLKYDLSEVVAVAPAEANAYLMTGSEGFSSDYSVHRFGVRFFKVEVDRSRRLRREVELSGDVEAVMAIHAATSVSEAA